MPEGIVIRDITADAAIQLGGIKIRDGTYTAFAFNEGFPKLFNPRTNRRKDTKPCDNNTFFQHSALNTTPRL